MLVQWELTKLGLAAGLMMESIGDKEPSVRRVLEDSDVISFPLWPVAHKELKSSKRIRVVFDLLAESLHSRVVKCLISSNRINRNI